MSQSPDFVVKIIKNYWDPGQKILEIGCGPSFLRKDFGEDYIGSDITNENYRPDLPRDVDIVCPADNLLLGNESVDFIVIKSAFFLFDNHKKALNEAMRVLKTGGRIIIFDYNRKTQKELQKKEGHNRYPCWTQWGLRNIIKSHGFSDVENFVASTEITHGIKKFISLVKQEIFGTWSIVCGVKP